MGGYNMVMDKRVLATMIAAQMATQEIPYSHGGDDPGLGGIDCSGFVRFIFRIVGLIPYNMDMRAIDFFRSFKENIVSTPYMGCLVFYGENRGEIEHVMFCLDNKRCVGAAGKYVNVTGVQETDIYYRHDIVAIVDPFKGV